MAPVQKDSKQAARLVLTAIRNLKGATLKNINNYIHKKYPKCASNELQLKKVINKAVAFGALKRRRNKYILGEVLNHIVEAKRRRNGKGKRTRRRRRSRRR